MKEKRTKIVGILGIFLIVIGLIIFFYPIVANLLATQNHSTVIRNYETQVESISEEKLLEEYNKAVIYNENLSGDPVHDPFLSGSRLCDSW